MIVCIPYALGAQRRIAPAGQLRVRAHNVGHEGRRRTVVGWQGDGMEASALVEMAVDSIPVNLSNWKLTTTPDR